MVTLNLRRVIDRGILSTATRACIEQLEDRQLLSIAGPPLAGPYNQTGAFWTYKISTAAGESATYYVKAMGLTTFNGISCYELDEGSTLQARDYVGLDGSGNLVEYGGSTQIGNGTQTTVNDTADVTFPAMFTAGVTYTSDYTTTDTDVESDGTTSTDHFSEHDIEKLESETPQSATVTAGTYEAYTLDSTSTETQIGIDGATPSTATGSGLFVPGVGYIKANDTDGTTYELISFQDQPDQLAFTQGPVQTTPGETMPAVQVSAVDPGGNVDPNASGSVTLTLASASRLTTYTGTLSGTLTEPLVNGVATFSDLSVSSNGIYTLSATDTNNDTGGTSDKFKIGSTSLQVEINDKVVKKSKNSAGNGVSPGDEILYSVLVTPQNETIQDANLMLTLPSGFTPTGLTGGGTFSGNTITWNVNTRVYNFNMVVPEARVLNGLKAVVVSADDNVTYTDATTDEGTATNTENIATVAGLQFVQQPGGAVAGQTLAPPVTVAVKDIYGATDTTATDTIALTLKGGKLSGTVSAPAVNGVATFTNLAVNKAGKYTLSATDASNKKIKAAASDQFVMVSMKSIIGTVATIKKSANDNSLTITDANVFTVAQSNGTMSLLATGFSPSTPGGLARIHWDVERNTQDVATGVLPSIVQGSSPLNATVSFNQAVGSFNLICYYDTDGSGSYDSGEALRVFHLAEVGTIVQAGGSVVPSNANFVGKTYSDGNSTVVSGSFSGNHWAITTSEIVQLLGGGADGMIGTSKIHLGWLQNGIGDTFAVKYANGSSASEGLKAGKFPVLDSTYLGPRDAIFLLGLADQDPPPAAPGPMRDTILGTNEAGGEDLLVETADSPTVSFKTKKAGSDAVSTSGSNFFAEYLSAYSDDFSTIYDAYYKVDWSAAFVFSRSSDGGWADAGSSVNEVETNLGNGMDLTSLGVNIKGPKFNEVALVK